VLCAVSILALRGVQNQGLLHLSQSANKCKAVLEEHLQLARRVVHLNELSRRLETVQEQVVKEEVSMMSIHFYSILLFLSHYCRYSKVLPFGHGQIQDGHSLIIASGLDNRDPSSHAAHDK
jgi:hypothetical protein